MRSSGAALLFVFMASAVMSKEVTTESGVPFATAPAAVLMPAEPRGPEAAKHWLDPLLVKAKNVSHLDPMAVKRFKVMVPSDGWTNANFHADFSGGSAIGLSRLTRSEDCTVGEQPDTIECRLGMRNVHIKLKAEVKGDVFIPTIHPMATTSSFSESTVLLQLQQVSRGENRTGAFFELRNATLSDEPNVQTSFIGTLSLSSKRLNSFRSKLSEALIKLLKDDLLPNYMNILNNLVETNF